MEVWPVEGAPAVHDERVSIEMLVNGAATLAYLWQRLGAAAPDH